MADDFGKIIIEDDDDSFYDGLDSGDEVLDDDDDSFYDGLDSGDEVDVDSEDDVDVADVKVEPEETTSEGNVVEEKPKNKLVIEDYDESEGGGTSKGNIEDILTSEEKMRYFSDKVMSAIVGGKSINEYALGRLMSSVNPRIFRDENYIVFSIFHNYRDRIRHINIDSEFIQLYLDNNRKIIEKSQGYIDKHAYGEVDGSDTLGYIAGVVKHFNKLCSMPDMPRGEFDLNFEKYVIVFKAIEAQKVYARSNQILTEGLKVGGKTLVGFEDSYNYSRRQLAEIEGLLDMNQGSGFESMREVLLASEESKKKPIKVADFDKLEKLNEYYGGIYTGNFYQVLAPAKAGKSKFCARICHTAAVKYGTNVTVWAQEGGNVAWTAQMRAIHFDYTYNEGASIKDRKYGIDQDTILKGDFPTQELRDLEATSKIDLASNTEYGNVDYIDRPFNVETFIEDIDASVKANGSRLVIIDYLQLIGSENSRVSDRERIAKAYKDALNYCKKNNVALLTPGQYKQDVIDALANKGDTADAEMRTAGGGSSEVLRTPDITFAFWASTADLRNNSMKILSMPCRFNKPFPEIPCYIDLGTCNFVSV